MLGSEQLYSKSINNQRRRIDTRDNCQNTQNALTKEEKRRVQMTTLANKYFNKISNAVMKANTEDKKSIHFYYNYYDFVNDRLGKPHGFLNEFMYEMCYTNSEFIQKDTNGNSITLKTLFGHSFNWELKGKNMMIISW
jgi:hypothetical protein